MKCLRLFYLSMQLDTPQIALHCIGNFNTYISIG